MKKSELLRMMTFMSLLFSLSISASTCFDSRDSYSNYDNRIKQSDIRNLASEYYLMSYSWAPRFCKKANRRSKQSGGKNFLQCNASNSFGYILHGLWPQGKKSGVGGYPRACEGDQPKIARRVLNPYLCMTPSVWLLQHEYEYHGTCMPTRALKTPKGYLDAALKLHQTLTLPQTEIPNKTSSFVWWYENNPGLVDGSIIYASKSKEWQFCYDNQFKSMRCPKGKLFNVNTQSTVNINPPTPKSTPEPLPVLKVANAHKTECIIKGNISKKSKNKTYFLQTHPQYSAVKIDKSKGEKCFRTEEQAKAAGWRSAR